MKTLGIVLLLLMCFASPLLAGRADDVVRVNSEKFLQMSPDDQVLYTKAVLDTLEALLADRLIPVEMASCSRSLTYGELISGVNSYLYKGLGAEDPAVKEAAKTPPVSIWIVRVFWEKCGEKRK